MVVEGGIPVDRVNSFGLWLRDIMEESSEPEYRVTSRTTFESNHGVVPNIEGVIPVLSATNHGAHFGEYDIQNPGMNHGIHSIGWPS